MSQPACWEEDFVVASYETDFRGVVSLFALFNRFQEIAGVHANKLNVGFDLLQESRLAWVLSRVKVNIRALPRWGERVHLETWPKGIDRLFARREFRLMGSAPEPLVVATTGWLLVDIAKGRPRRIDSLPIDLTFPRAEHAIDDPLAKLVPPPGLVEQRIQEVLPGDIDVNQHVNNAQYVRWLTDCFSLEEIRTHTVRSLQINYLEETLPGDRIRLLRTPRGDGSPSVFFVGESETKRTTVFHAVVLWEECPAPLEAGA